MEHIWNQNAMEQPANPRPDNANNVELTVLSPDYSTVYYVSPPCLETTRGSQSLSKNFDLYGAFMRKEHFLCLNPTPCPSGESCKDIHVIPSLKGTLRSHPIHRNLPDSDAPRYPPGLSIEIFHHKTRAMTSVDSGSVLITAGSKDYFAKIEAKEALPRMQQCTHFQRRHCLRGPECGFLHVLNHTPQERPSTTAPPLSVPAPLSGHRSSVGSTPTLSPGISQHSLSPNTSPNTSQSTLPLPPQVVYVMQPNQMPVAVNMNQHSSPNTSQSSLPHQVVYVMQPNQMCSPVIPPAMMMPVIVLPPQPPSLPPSVGFSPPHHMPLPHYPQIPFLPTQGSGNGMMGAPLPQVKRK